MKARFSRRAMGVGALVNGELLECCSEDGDLFRMPASFLDV
ncbi:MAG: hypothetical protein ACLPUG_12990 [Acidimicrobiales bacterium]|jgi:hypothetical protein